MKGYGDGVCHWRHTLCEYEFSAAATPKIRTPPDELETATLRETKKQKAALPPIWYATYFASATSFHIEINGDSSFVINARSPCTGEKDSTHVCFLRTSFWYHESKTVLLFNYRLVGGDQRFAVSSV